MNQPLEPRLLGELLDQHGRVLQQYARQWSGSPEDCVQEAFVKLAAEIPPPENRVAWLYRVVRNLAINDLRAEKRRRSHEFEKSILDRSKPETSADTDGVLTLLNELSGGQREVVTLRIWGKLTWEEIADVLGTSSSSAHRKYSEAIQQLKDLWGQHV